MDKIVIYTDGACSGNQFDNNKGGWGVVLKYKDTVKELYGNAKDTTNNIMELAAVIRALLALKKTNIPVEIYTDSNYVCQGVNLWSKKWEVNGWINSQKKPVENKELWIQLLELAKRFEDIQFIWVKGHANNAGNIRADELANKGISELN